MARTAKRRGIYRALVGKPEGKRRILRPRHRWEDNIKTHFQGIGWGGVNCTYVAQKRDKWWVLREHGNKP